MKKLFYIGILIAMALTSCQDVIDVDLQTAEPRLVIDASLSWKKGTNGSSQSIRLTLTAPYFADNVPPATGATVSVTDSNNTSFNFLEQGESGVYTNANFIPVIDETYTLNINYKNETYTATETLVPVVPIDFVEQKNDGGFSGEDIEIKVYYTDPADIENFYLFEFLVVERNTLSLEVYDDEFTDGNQIFAFYTDEDLKAGDELIIKNSGISERTYNFLNILLQQTDDNSGDPFETQPATVRGNCINTSNPKNYPLGYFRVTETDEITYIVQ
ncbi:DUF4249 domain-containing protein [Tamlana fucoidanivorans]|uniref:DUF4249 domain-containing protein n=1 Tax=Allotamlana fucoidanivorans TaxID=2583814 RepID=A0A5C4SII1_9FLAO|nr:DUF4249 domain-containing protein [Tamlana fucoidanivorans]TNJ43132.1 DUF4249 domain-containing protein [Tamlana fucoidanivorans]